MEGIAQKQGKTCEAKKKIIAIMAMTPVILNLKVKVFKCKIVTILYYRVKYVTQPYLNTANYCDNLKVQRCAEPSGDWSIL